MSNILRTIATRHPDWIGDFIRFPTMSEHRKHSGNLSQFRYPMLIDVRGINNLYIQANQKALVNVFQRYVGLSEECQETIVFLNAYMDIEEQTENALIDALEAVSCGESWSEDYLYEEESKAQTTYIRHIYTDYNEFLIGWLYAKGETEAQCDFYEWLDDRNGEFCYDGQKPVLSIDQQDDYVCAGRLEQFLRGKHLNSLRKDQ